MQRELFSSISAMLTPEVLAAIEGHPVRRIEQTAFASVDSLSGSHFVRVRTDSASYILKRINIAWDWVMRATGDTVCRPTLAWSTGLLDQLPAQIEHGTVAAAIDGEGWAVLTRDFTGAMIPPGDDHITEADNAQFVDHMAALHATFWGRSELADPARGFMPSMQRYQSLTPEVGRREADCGEPIPPMIVEGWELLWELIDRDVADIMKALLTDPGPLAQALARCPQTVIHGDWKLGNLGITRGTPSRTILIDWAVPGPAAPTVDLAWYLAVNSARLPVSKEATIELYRAALQRHLGSRFDEAWWQPALELALLGGFLQLAWPKALGAAKGDPEVQAREWAELRWWSDRVREGARRL